MTPEQFEEASRLRSIRDSLRSAIRSFLENQPCGVHSVSFETLTTEHGRLSGGIYTVKIGELELDPDNRSERLFVSIKQALEEYLARELDALNFELKKLGLDIDPPGVEQ